MAFNRGASLPPITVVRIGEAYAIRDGHHRVSVARANGAVSIPANVVA
jgi:ParB-like chromosome segregation protein Spo0J